jgi:hypothetical protein
MLQSRRGFLIGAGAMLTTAFVKDARPFIHRNSQPPADGAAAGGRDHVLV